MVVLVQKSSRSRKPFNKYTSQLVNGTSICLTAGEGLGYCQRAGQFEITREEITRSTKVRWIILKHFKEDIMVLHKRLACPSAGI